MVGLIKFNHMEINMRNNPDDLSNQLIAKIKTWLEDEVITYEDIQERIYESDKNGEKAEDICDVPEVFYGRKECAESLLEQITKWEKDNADK